MHLYEFYPEQRYTIDIDGNKINTFEYNQHVRLMEAQFEWFSENKLDENMPNIDRPWFHINCLSDFAEK